jgi:hypothetical protein
MADVFGIDLNRVNNAFLSDPPRAAHGKPARAGADVSDVRPALDAE